MKMAFWAEGSNKGGSVLKLPRDLEGTNREGVEVVFEEVGNDGGTIGVIKDNLSIIKNSPVGNISGKVQAIEDEVFELLPREG
jgi:hypothetical protein